MYVSFCTQKLNVTLNYFNLNKILKFQPTRKKMLNYGMKRERKNLKDMVIKKKLQLVHNMM